MPATAQADVDQRIHQAATMEPVAGQIQAVSKPNGRLIKRTRHN
jgi:hypothetical protein